MTMTPPHHCPSFFARIKKKLKNSPIQLSSFQEAEWLTSYKNNQDGKPYILSVAAGAAEPDQRSQGYTFVAKSEFASLEDLKYYDDECTAHQALKKVAMTLGVEGIMTVYFKPQLVGGAAP